VIKARKILTKSHHSGPFLWSARGARVCEEINGKNYSQRASDEQHKCEASRDNSQPEPDLIKKIFSLHSPKPPKNKARLSRAEKRKNLPEDKIAKKPTILRGKNCSEAREERF
jgi:hypothetical protein